MDRSKSKLATHLVAAAALLIIAAGQAIAQTPASVPSGRELYVSWGYNTEQYRPVDIHFVQSPLGNDFTLQSVIGHDQKGWTDLFNNAITGTQYSARVGYFFNRSQDLALEVSFEHPRFIVTQNQTVRMIGTLRGERVDQNVALTEDFLKYKLNNGANFLLFNLVKRVRLAGDFRNRGSVSALLKAGAGFNVPHPTNVVFGQANDPHFQFGGLDLGIEGAVRLHLTGLVYLEFAQKGVYARYPRLDIPEGRAKQSLWVHVSALSLGTSLRLGR